MQHSSRCACFSFSFAKSIHLRLHGVDNRFERFFRFLAVRTFQIWFSFRGG